MKFISTFLILVVGYLYQFHHLELRSQNFLQQQAMQAFVARSGSIQKLKQVPVLCYHNIKAGKTGDYTVSINDFKAQLKLLADSGYHTILPVQLCKYIMSGSSLPTKPFMLTFDDTRIEHYSVASSEMDKYGFKGVFFIMTVCIGKPGYVTATQIKTLSDKGNVIGCHTWNHPDVRTLKEQDWVMQIDKQKIFLEKIVGKPVDDFAYPYGVWNEAAIEELKKRGIKSAFQLSAKQSEKEALYTIRRMIVAGGWSAKQIQYNMRASFK